MSYYKIVHPWYIPDIFYYDSKNKLEFDSDTGIFRKIGFIERNFNSLYVNTKYHHKITKEEYFKNVPYCDCLKNDKQELISRDIDVVKFFKTIYKDIKIDKIILNNKYSYMISKDRVDHIFYLRVYRDYACATCETCLSERHLLKKNLAAEVNILESLINKEYLLDRVCGII